MQFSTSLGIALTFLAFSHSFPAFYAFSTLRHHSVGRLRMISGMVINYSPFALQSE